MTTSSRHVAGQSGAGVAPDADAERTAAEAGRRRRRRPGCARRAGRLLRSLLRPHQRLLGVGGRPAAGPERRRAWPGRTWSCSASTGASRRCARRRRAGAGRGRRRRSSVAAARPSTSASAASSCCPAGSARPSCSTCGSGSTTTSSGCRSASTSATRRAGWSPGSPPTWTRISELVDGGIDDLVLAGLSVVSVGGHPARARPAAGAGDAARRSRSCCGCRDWFRARLRASPTGAPARRSRW